MNLKPTPYRSVPVIKQVRVTTIYKTNLSLRIIRNQYLALIARHQFLSMKNNMFALLLLISFYFISATVVKLRQLQSIIFSLPPSLKPRYFTLLK